MAIHRSLFVIVAALLAVIAGTFAAGKLTTDYLLYEDATSTAEWWARSLAENVHDLDKIAGGEQPSSLSLQYLTWAQQLGLVFRYVIFNPEGYSQMVADERRIAPVNISVHSDQATAAGRLRQPIVAVRTGGSDGLPSLVAEAFVPIIADGRLIATVAAYVDQTEQRDRFATAFLAVAGGICLLTGLAFAVPAAAWYRRTREKEYADAEIRFLFTHDGMTRLMNRDCLKHELAEAVGAECFDRGARRRALYRLRPSEIDQRHLRPCRRRCDHEADGRSSARDRASGRCAGADRRRRIRDRAARSSSRGRRSGRRARRWRLRQFRSSSTAATSPRP